MTHIDPAKILLTFPQGQFFVTERKSLYALAPSGHAAYLCKTGQAKELHGKFAYDAQSESANYTVTYEVDDDTQLLLAAKLISDFGRVSGSMADEAELAALNAKLANGDIELIKEEEPAYIMRAAELSDGRQIVLVEENDGKYRRPLYMVENGAATELEIENGIQGGNSFFFNLKDGTRVELPYGMGGPKRGENPIFGDRVMQYIELQGDERYDLSRFGIQGRDVKPYYNPFHSKWPSL